MTGPHYPDKRRNLLQSRGIRTTSPSSVCVVTTGLPWLASRAFTHHTRDDDDVFFFLFLSPFI
ncbi:hypothetical protein E2C01_012090 [Portunus trituberculatus]|uniref:Uncharacterized protein n=1 Tax=Portunus trituberculatus TaxID=210409 RepID=A0A5B7DCS9_PORTR|nr:hypothetical protein [Portunus trituberculatus]